MYDFANSSYTTLVVTFIYATFFTKLMAEDDVVGTALWSRGVTITAVVVAVLSPFAGAIADRGGLRKALLGLCTIVCVVATVLLYFPMPYATATAGGGASHAAFALALFVAGNIAFEMSQVFYNAFLPDIADSARIGRVSGYGWALGYVGGLLCMVVAFAGFVFPDAPWFGLSKDDGENVRATNLLVAAWFAVFAIPMFLWVKEDRTRAETSRRGLFAKSFRQIVQTFRQIRPYRQIVRLLLARLIYNDGLVTIFAFGGIYASTVFDFTFEEVMIFGIVLNVTAGIGAFAMGFLDDKIGGKWTIFITLVGLAIATVLAMTATSREGFWIAGIVVGLLSGPNQAASRSLLGRFVPPDKENEFFGFFALSGKATAFLGPFFFGVLTEAFSGGPFEPQRAGIAVVFVFFVVGGLLLLTVDEKAGRLAARPAQ
jgi:MFS transporter, UMF1 family